MIKLSEDTIHIVNALFPENLRNEVVDFLELECAENIPFCENHDQYKMERIRFAVLKLSEGKITKLVDSIELAQVDWRDLFMAAGFGYDPEGHINWFRNFKKEI
jgi:hypothetical protein